MRDKVRVYNGNYRPPNSYFDRDDRSPEGYADHMRAMLAAPEGCDWQLAALASFPQRTITAMYTRASTSRTWAH